LTPPSSSRRDAPAALRRPAARGRGRYAAPGAPEPLIRSELFSAARLEQHAESLAAAQRVAPGTARGLPLARRLRDNERFLRRAHAEITRAIADQRAITPAAEWLADNFHVVETQIGEIRAALPGPYYRRLPKLADGPLRGLPRVFGIAWAFVAHSDSRLAGTPLAGFVTAYQRVQPLTIGELWGVALALRLVLVENLRRAAQGIVCRGAERAAADDFAETLAATPEATPSRRSRDAAPLPAAFAAQLVLRLRDHDPAATPAIGWLDERLRAQGTDADRVVADELLRQSADDVTVRNVVTSLRQIAAVDWAEFFESVSQVDAALAAGSGFAAMDFRSRDRYRHAVEDLAHGSGRTEGDVVEQALGAANEPVDVGDDAARQRRRDPGHHLLGAGRRAFERRLGYRVRLDQRMARLRLAAGLPGYLAANAVLACTFAAALWVALWATGAVPWLATVAAAAALVLAADLAIAIVHHCITRQLGPVTLPGLELRGGVPPQLRALLAMPTMLSSHAAIAAHVERLEVHYLASPGDDLVLALVSDWTDADAPTRDGDDDLLAAARAGIARLNERHGRAPSGDRFLLLHRRRVWNAGERQWIGWERKRGKLHEVDRWLRGASDTTFVFESADVARAPPGIRYVVTLDGDSRLPRGALRQLVGKMAHPLQRPSLDPSTGRVCEGHAVLQPRITPALPDADETSWYQHLFAAPGGFDPYSSAVSDVYQDLLGEGSYAGKGIYDVDAFESALAGRVPDSTVLSHDLLEGVFARAGLVTDVEVVEDAPTRYDVAAARQHRWARGDWQLLPWVLGRGRDASGAAGRAAIPFAGRWKMLDNLRRTLLAPTAVLLLAGTWVAGSAPAAVAATAFVVACTAIPMALPVGSELLARRRRCAVRVPLRRSLADLGLAALRTGLAMVMLGHQATLMTHAVATTLSRLFVRRRMLEWLTSAQSGGTRAPGAGAFYRLMGTSVALSLLAAVALVAAASPALPAALPLLALWIGAPAVAHQLSRVRRVDPGLGLAAEHVRSLRAHARRTWSFFTTFVGEADHWLPPDNFQESPVPVVAHRTSPTNVGLYLLSVTAARDFGWITTADAASRLEATLDTVERLEHCRGHLLNWYDTRDLRPLEPKYVSTVDSGNLAGHLVAVGEACREWAAGAQLPHPCTPAAWRAGIGDAVGLAADALARLPDEPTAGGTRAQLAAALAALAQGLHHGDALHPSPAARLAELATTADTAHDLAQVLADESAGDGAAGVLEWIGAARACVDSHRRALHATAAETRALAARLLALHRRAEVHVAAMDFAFLLEPQRRLLAIGYRVADAALDASHYDLLASEARLASFVAIAKGDVPVSHWFRLGRAATRVRGGAVLRSWSGSLFEYLMPSLVLREPASGLLAHTNRLVVRRQIEYGAELGVPWGISESAYNVRDLDLTYQYSSFGVPGLGQKRGLDDDTVIAPYATALASMVDPLAAIANYARIAAAGGEGRHGGYDALDYTPSRRPPGSRVAVVQAWMAHHQGMTIVALANTLHRGIVRTRFHRSPAVQATELLLQERVPRGLPVAAAEARLPRPAASAHPTAPAPMRRFHGPHDATPRTHLLGNGRYAVMLTAAGSGCSRWLDTAITRWREDATTDAWGSWCYVRDRSTGATWSAGYQPTAVEPDSYAVAFAEGRAEITRRDGAIVTTLEVAVSPEHDAEVRRVSVTNHGAACELELTSYAEVVLTQPAADAAHPTFARMFVQTEHVAGIGALTATRRRRSPAEPELWAAHLAVVEGTIVGSRQFETDRARFLGRGNTARAPIALADGRALTNTAGTVLDPIFSWRVRLRVEAGEVARVAFWTMVAPTRREVLDLADKHRDPAAFERATTMAWAQAQVQLRHLGIGAEEALLFQRLANRVLYSDPSLRPPDRALRGGRGPAALWSQGISGDLPIVLARVLDEDDLPLVRQLLRAQQYWRSKQLAVDLVIVNEHAHSYAQHLHAALEGLVRTVQRAPQTSDAAAGRVFVLRHDLVAPETRSTLQAVARAVLLGRGGSLAEQVRRRPEPSLPAPPPWPQWPAAAAGRAHAIPTPPPECEFWNGTGGFTAGGREYTTILRDGETTPAPWINVVANPDFGFQASAGGSGYTWSGNSRENQLTPWSNDPTADAAGEAFFVRDVDSGAVCSPTAQPLRQPSGTFTARHGQGYCRFAHDALELSLELLQLVPLTDAVKVSRLRILNRSGRTRTLTVTAYVEWVLGSRRENTAHHVVTEVDRASSVMLARNPWRQQLAERTAFLDLDGLQTRWTADRAEFLGRNGTLERPRCLAGDATLSGRAGAGLDPCGALQADVVIPPHGHIDVVACLGEAQDGAAAVALAQRYRTTDVDVLLQQVLDHWDELLAVVQVRTPDRSFDLLLNRWLLYQTVVCRLWARSAFYQAGGAYGFRDQLQDTMAVAFARPALARAHLLRAAARQYGAGDVQHWWLPGCGSGVRTRVSDDAVWLAHATAHYVRATGDHAVLDERVPFLGGRTLAAGEQEAFLPATGNDGDGTLFEHCARALDASLAVGARGLPLIGGGDWNDGLNRVGSGGRGESVWLAWFLHGSLLELAALAADRGEREREREQSWRDHAARLAAALDRDAWDGAWYRRGWFDDGSPLGSAASEACRIDSIAQSWAVLSGAGDPARAAQAMAAMYRHLVRPADGLVLLFTPPFDDGPLDPGYVRGYPPGIRENGGQYTHAALWAVMAFARLGDGDRAAELFGFLNPIRRARSRADVRRYRVEPYVVAADVYSVAPHVGRGGWTWYTGSAGWMHRAGLEAILGFRVTGRILSIDPCVPAAWRSFTIEYTRGATRYRIQVANANGKSSGVVRLELDGVVLAPAPPHVPLVDDGAVHDVRVELG
jgi:cyclic beta-1,2-glucan synthetase